MCKLHLPHGHCKPADFPLVPSNAAKPVGCSGCKKPFVGEKWSCPCNRIWYNCPCHPPRNRHTESRLPGKRKAPRAFAPHEAEAKLAKIEPRLANRALIGPKLCKKFPYLVSGHGDVASTITSHNGTSAAASSGMAAADSVASEIVATPHDTQHPQHIHYPIREDFASDCHAAAPAAVDARPAGAGADSTAGVVADRLKRRSKPFRIPKG